MDELLGNPMLLLLSLVLGLLSFAFTTAGIRAGRMSWALWGVAMGVPSYAPAEPLLWGLGAVIGFFAWKAGQLQ